MKQKNVRHAVFAGTWYPGSKTQLTSTVQGYLSNINKANLNGTIKAIIVPHAGYPYSGQVAAAAFKQLDDIYTTIFLLGPSHRYPLSGVSVSNYTDFENPLGSIKVSEKAKDLLKEELIENIPEADIEEHSLEIELPFLQEQLTKFEIVSILVGDVDPEKLKKVLLSYLAKEDLILVSADMSHYHPYEEAVKLDSYTIKAIGNLDDKGIFNAEIDAPWAVATLLKIAKEKNWKPYLVHYANSGDVTGDKSAVVGYSAWIFVDEGKKDVKGAADNSNIEKTPLTNEEQKTLLKLARDTASNYLKTGKKPIVDESEITPALKKIQGCFTTLNKDGMLRGCIGHILPQEELYKCVMDNAINAAVNDPRFPPVEPEELKDIEIEISVLSIPEKLDFSSGEDLKKKLRPNIDGVVLKKGFKSSTYLPQVWQQLPNKEEFLSSLCEKGGMKSDCWKDISTEVFTYRAFVFNEKN